MHQHSLTRSVQIENWSRSKCVVIEILCLLSNVCIIRAFIQWHIQSETTNWIYSFWLWFSSLNRGPPRSYHLSIWLCWRINTCKRAKWRLEWSKECKGIKRIYGIDRLDSFWRTRQETLMFEAILSGWLNEFIIMDMLMPVTVMTVYIPIHWHKTKMWDSIGNGFRRWRWQKSKGIKEKSLGRKHSKWKRRRKIQHNEIHSL